MLWSALDNLVPIRDSGLAENPSFSQPGDPNADDEQKALRAGFDKVVLAITALATLVYSHNQEGKKLHIQHSYGRGVASKFEEDDPMLQGADGERLKRAIKAEKDEKERLKEKEPRNKKSWRPRSYGEGRPDFKRKDDRDDRDRRPRGDRDRGCFMCGSTGHMARDYPRRKGRRGPGHVCPTPCVN